jgi:hypothetical protein
LELAKWLDVRRERQGSDQLEQAADAAAKRLVALLSQLVQQRLNATVSAEEHADEQLPLAHARARR